METVRRSSASRRSSDEAGVQLEDMDSRMTNSSTETLTKTESKVPINVADVEDNGREPVVANMEDIALKALHTDDDPTLSPWTFRMFFLGQSDLKMLVCERHCANERYRDRSILFRFILGDNIPFQASIRICVCHLLDRHQLCWR